MKSFLHIILVYAWSLSFEAVFNFTIWLSKFHSTLAHHIHLRSLLLKNMSLAKKLASSRPSFCFWCSSAGEYEQASPLIDKLIKQHQAQIIIIFFSQSGYDFARSKKEKNLYFLFALDSVFFWNRFFSTLQPKYTVVVRHELWPAFLYSAQKFSTLVLINASHPAELQQSFCKKYLKKYLVSFFDRIFVVAQNDYNYFNKQYHVSKKKLLVGGDTKYERAYLRASNHPKEFHILEQEINKTGCKKQRLIVGSAWSKDIQLVLDSLLLLKKATKAQVMIIPHKITKQVIEEVVLSCQKRNLSYLIIDQEKRLQVVKDLSVKVLIIKAMGVLADLYECGSLAYVGGGLHHQVHNVLEPFVYGIDVAFGPCYKNSPEACNLVSHNMAKVISNPHTLASWWLQQAQEETTNTLKFNKYIDKQLGACDFILEKSLAPPSRKMDDSQTLNH